MAYWYTGSAFHQIPQSYLFLEQQSMKFFVEIMKIIEPILF